MKLNELITNAPWREAVTYRENWPHEYVLLQKDGQRELLEAVCERFRNCEGAPPGSSAWTTCICSSASISPNPPKRWALELTQRMMGKGRRTGPARFQ